MSEATAQVSIVVDAERKKVWEALTDPDLISEYFMGARVSTDWQVGSPVTFTGEWKGQPFEDKGEILTFDPPTDLSYSHWSPLSGAPDVPDSYHVVDIALAEAGSGTKVTLTQSNLTGGVTDADRSSRDDYEKNWTMVLDGLKKVVER